MFFPVQIWSVKRKHRIHFPCVSVSSLACIVSISAATLLSLSAISSGLNSSFSRSFHVVSLTALLLILPCSFPLCLHHSPFALPGQSVSGKSVFVRIMRVSPTLKKRNNEKSRKSCPFFLAETERKSVRFLCFRTRSLRLFSCWRSPDPDKISQVVQVLLYA